jgi:hypothetical protein
METELSPELHAFIKDRAAVGDTLAREARFEDAVRVYNEAWSRVPEPKSEWEASTWLLAAIGDACFLGGFYSSGVEAFEFALRCPGGMGNPFVHAESGAHAEAAEHLTRAYAIQGKAIFRAEDPKYFEFLKARIEPPAGGEW